MDQLIKTLPLLMRVAGNVEEVALTVAQAGWNHVAGEAVRRHTRATGLQKQRLTVAVSDSVWQRQLESMSAQFLYRLNALLGDGTIRFIEFRVDQKTFEAGTQQHPRRETSRAGSEPLPLELVSAAASIQRPELRRAFLGAASSCIRRRESDNLNADHPLK